MTSRRRPAFTAVPRLRATPRPAALRPTPPAGELRTEAPSAHHSGAPFIARPPAGSAVGAGALAADISAASTPAFVEPIGIPVLVLPSADVAAARPVPDAAASPLRPSDSAPGARTAANSVPTIGQSAPAGAAPTAVPALSTWSAAGNPGHDPSSQEISRGFVSRTSRRTDALESWLARFNAIELDPAEVIEERSRIRLHVGGVPILRGPSLSRRAVERTRVAS